MNTKLLSEWLGLNWISNPEEIVEATEQSIKKFEEEFEKFGGAQITQEQEQRWNAWLSSDQGREIYAELGRRLIKTLGLIHEDLDPAHDLRHLLMVDAAALRIIVEDGWTANDYQRVILISAFAHDFGRLIEFKMHSQLPGKIMPTHGYFSLLVLREVVGDLDFPEDLLMQIYYSVAYHTGPPGKGYDLENYLGKATQRADREQMINLEVVASTLAYEVAVRGFGLRSLLGENKNYFCVSTGRVTGNSLFDYLEAFSRNVILRAGVRGEFWQKNYEKRNTIFLWLAQTEEEREQMFAPELQKLTEIDLETPPHMRKKRIFSEEILEEVLAEVVQLPDELEKIIAGRNCEEMIWQNMKGAPELLSSQGARDYISTLVDKFTDEQKEKWKLAMAYVEVTRAYDKEAWHEVARQIQGRFEEESFEFRVAELVLSRL
ncbi:MAG: hypothetical protein LBG64_03610 [Pseudomonadales bacterium]|jgi:hypothetical protein|nr:hypothetical protein [Pseudomonadales bacterium]